MLSSVPNSLHLMVERTLPTISIRNITFFIQQLNTLNLQRDTWIRPAWGKKLRLKYDRCFGFITSSTTPFSKSVACKATSRSCLGGHWKMGNEQWRMGNEWDFGTMPNQIQNPTMGSKARTKCDNFASNGCRRSLSRTSVGCPKHVAYKSACHCRQAGRMLMGSSANPETTASLITTASVRVGAERASTLTVLLLLLLLLCCLLFDDTAVFGCRGLLPHTTTPMWGLSSCLWKHLFTDFVRLPGGSLDETIAQVQQKQYGNGASYQTEN